MKAECWAVVGKVTGLITPIEGVAAYLTASHALEAIKEVTDNPAKYPDSTKLTLDIMAVTLVKGHLA